MNAPRSSRVKARFGPFEMDLRAGELRKRGVRIRLQVQPFQILGMLLERPGEVVTREELRQALWPGDTFVDFDHGLNNAINRLREALSDSAESPRFVETLPRRGYRFIVSVTEVAAPLPASSPQVPPDASVPEAVRQLESRSTRWLWMVFAGIAVLTSATVLAMRARRSSNLSAPSGFHMSKISAPDPLYGVLSADGNNLAYVTATNNSQESLWLRPTNSAGAGVELVPPRSVKYWGVTIAPDNKSVYYIYDEAGSGLGVLFRVAAVGGVPQRLLEDVAAGPVFEPGGRRMVLKRYFHDAQGDGAQLITALSDGSQVRLIAESRAAYPYYGLDWTADGNILYSEGVHEALQTSWYITELSVEGGRPKRIVGPLSTPISSPQRLNALDIIAIANDGQSGVGQIWIFGAHGDARRVTNDTNQYLYLSVASASHQMLAAQIETEDTLWVADFGQRVLGRANVVLRPRLLSLPRGYYDWPAWTPDSNIVYVGTPGGASRELWWTTADGKQTRQLTSDGGYKRSPVVASDGRFIVYSSNRKGLLNVWRVEMDGTKPRQLTFGGSDGSPQISPSGKWIVYESHADGAWGLWKVPSEGGTATRIADSLETIPAISPDEKLLAYEHLSAVDHRRRWAIVSFESGAPESDVDLPSDADKAAWSSDARSLIFLRYAGGSPAAFWTQPISGGPPRKLVDLATIEVPASNWSFDGRKFVYLRRKQRVDFVLISGLP